MGETGFPPRAPSYRSLRSRRYHGSLAGEAHQAALPFAGAGLDRPSSYVKEPI